MVQAIVAHRTLDGIDRGGRGHAPEMAEPGQRGPAEIARSLARQPPDRRLQVAIGLGLGHAGGLAVDRIPPEPLVVPGPDPARGPVEDIAVIDGVVRQRQGVAAVGRRPDRLAEDERGCGSSRAESTRPTVSARQPLRIRRCRGSPGLTTRPARIVSTAPASRLGRQSAARPNPSRPGRPRDTPRGRAPARAAATRKAAGVSVITERLCQTRTGSQATIERGRQRPALARGRTLAPRPLSSRRSPAPSPRCKSAIPQRSPIAPARPAAPAQRIERRTIGGRTPLQGEALARTPATAPAADNCPGRRTRRSRGPSPPPAATTASRMIAQRGCETEARAASDRRGPAGTTAPGQSPGRRALTGQMYNRSDRIHPTRTASEKPHGTPSDHLLLDGHARIGLADPPRGGRAPHGQRPRSGDPAARGRRAPTR